MGGRRRVVCGVRRAIGVRERGERARRGGEQRREECGSGARHAQSAGGGVELEQVARMRQQRPKQTAKRGSVLHARLVERLVCVRVRAGVVANVQRR